MRRVAFIVTALAACSTPRPREAPAAAPSPGPPPATDTQAPEPRGAATPGLSAPATPREPATRRAFMGDRFGLLGARCPTDQPEGVDTWCNASREVVRVETAVDLAPPIPPRAELIIDRSSPGQRQASVAVALDGERLWIRTVSCGACRRVMGKASVFWLPGLDKDQENRLRDQLGLDGAKPLASSADVRAALRDHRQAPFDQLGEACAMGADASRQTCGRGGLVAIVETGSWHSSALPLRAELLVDRVFGGARGGHVRIAIDGDVLWIDSVTCRGCARIMGRVLAAKVSALTAAQASSLHQRLQLSSKTVPTDIAGWRTAISAEADVLAPAF